MSTQLVPPAPELPRLRLALDLEHPRGGAEVLGGVPEVDERQQATDALVTYVIQG